MLLNKYQVSPSLLLAELRRPKAAVEPLSFSYGHLCQRKWLAGAYVRTYDDDDGEAQDGDHTCQLMHCLHLCKLILEIQFMVN